MLCLPKINIKKILSLSSLSLLCLSLSLQKKKKKKKIESRQRSNIPVDHSRVCGKTYLMGEYELQNKCKIWRAKFALMEIHKAAQELLVMGQDPRHLFEGNALRWNYMCASP
uniref:Uncharacterized protein n=1 Tax=Urocitellus parryii TaxID=9999 RepID=A0A8D2KM09_UROPR